MIVYLWFCSGGLVSNLHLGAGTGFNDGGLEMVGFVFGSDSIVADGPEMSDFVWESGCCSAGDGLVITVFESGDGLVMIGFSGHMCWQLWQ